MGCVQERTKHPKQGTDLIDIKSQILAVHRFISPAQLPRGKAVHLCSWVSRSLPDRFVQAPQESFVMDNVSVPSPASTPDRIPSAPKYHIAAPCRTRILTDSRHPEEHAVIKAERPMKGRVLNGRSAFQVLARSRRPRLTSHTKVCGCLLLAAWWRQVLKLIGSASHGEKSNFSRLISHGGPAAFNT